MRLEQLRTGEHAARATEPRVPTEVCARARCAFATLQCFQTARRTFNPPKRFRPEDCYECKRESGLASAALRLASGH